MDMKFEQAIKSTPKVIEQLLLMVNESVQASTKEICIRVNKPITLQTFNGVCFLTKQGQAIRNITKDCFITTYNDIYECIKIITEYSLHSYRDKINNGYITIKGGHRVGIIGSCSYNQEKMVSVNDISSINIRVARQIKGVAKDLTNQLFKDKLYSTLIVGSPCSGKTTLLRDMAYWLSSEDMLYKVAIIDERGEIASVQGGVAQNDTGLLTDVLDGYKKGEGMRLAIRSMSPEIIVLDEIGGVEDAVAIRESMNAGVAVIATVHAGSIEELYKKQHIIPLIENGFERIVMLKSCKVSQVITEVRTAC